MGWTHDYRDVSRNSRGRGAAQVSAAHLTHDLRDPRDPHEFGDPRDPRLGIPRILGRRARWVGARLRHTRN
ncbi:hypothetical protein V1J52_19095 [Streptomyces sp. TRM 70351]|uniref:hypothetical protein n=1 Tax=Streptomyces sp. TRM 70351 TaxID=3116552 RepID=UPI002E7C0F6B|nr:hypothetical protein [Streptomyces sp. TRM 70351]MEE1930263.1 hypothetical protein [Streptomyces sp. TRM 70351]